MDWRIHDYKVFPCASDYPRSIYLGAALTLREINCAMALIKVPRSSRHMNCVGRDHLQSCERFKTRWRFDALVPQYRPCPMTPDPRRDFVANLLPGVTAIAIDC